MEEKTKTSGFLLIDKEPGISSFGVIHRLRRMTGIKRIGHAGTLDPFASGLLIVAVGREATREIGHFIKLDKSYEAQLCLGATSATQDPEGEIKKCEVRTIPDIETIKTVLESFVGQQFQIPPMHSAKKVNGQRLYTLARKGKEIEREAVPVRIDSIGLLDYEWPHLKIRTAVSSGTYIRTLGSDIGEKLGTGAYLRSLRRLSIGNFQVTDSKRLIELGDWRERLFLPPLL